MTQQQTQLSLEEFAFRCLWIEHMRLSNHIGPYEVQKHFRMCLARCKRGDSGLLKNGRRTMWTAMVENWYKLYRLEGRS